MAATLRPAATETELTPSDDSIIGAGGGPADPGDGPHGHGEAYPDPYATPLTVYRAITFWVIASVVVLFSALTVIVKSRWADSDDWFSVSLPHILFLNTAILLASSVAIEMARAAVRANTLKKCVQWLLATLALGLVFLGGQIAAWEQLVREGLNLGANPGSFFIYVVSGTHGVHLLGGIAALAIVSALFRRWRAAKQEIAVDALALYWHFMDGLWIYLLVLLFITIQR